MQIRRCRGCAATAWVFALALVLVAGCSSPRGGEGEVLTPEQQEIGNLREAVDVLKQALRNMSDERETFQNKYLSANDELRTRAQMVEFLEAEI